MTTRDPAQPGLWQRWADLMVTLRWAVVLGWIVLAVIASSATSSLSAGLTGLNAILPEDSPAVRAEVRAHELFDLPVLSRLAVVQHDPDGLDLRTQAGTVQLAAELDVERLEQGLERVGSDEPLAALPVLNTGGLFPSSAQDGTTAITFLFAAPGSPSQQTKVATAYAERLGGDEADVVGVTGLAPAQTQQARLILDRLPVVESATVAFVMLVVGVAFRSVVAPLVPVFASAVAFLVTMRVLQVLASLTGSSLPQEFTPVVVALLLGVVTDYALFYLFGLSRRLAAGQPRLVAARGAAGDYQRIVVAAGLTVAVVTASLLVAEMGVYRSMGPGLAITVLIGCLVSVTLIPALMGIAGGFLLWPRAPSRDGAGARASGRGGPGQWLRRALGVKPHWLIHALSHRGPAAAVTVACLAGLLLAAAPVRDLRLDLSFTAGLPASDPVQQAAAAAGAGFARGIVSPTALLVEEEGIADQSAELARLGEELAEQPGVAGVIGPTARLPTEPQGVLLSRTGDAARFLLILDADPLGADAMDTLQDVMARMPALMESAGLSGATVSAVGNTAVALEIIETTKVDLRRVAVAACVISVLVLMVFLRSLIAPIYLLIGNVLSVASALGLTTWVFQGLLDRPGITFYVPFATAVLLIALGSDYNVFSVGEIWAKARTLPLRQAVVETVPRSGRIISTAGIALAGSLALLAVIPLWPFQQIAFTMAVGLLLDVFVVRLLLVPSLITLVGPLSLWPSRRARLSSTEPVGALPATSP